LPRDALLRPVSTLFRPDVRRGFAGAGWRDPEIHRDASWHIFFPIRTDAAATVVALRLVAAEHAQTARIAEKPTA